MGEVYLARHPRLPRNAALKILRPEISNDKRTRVQPSSVVLVSCRSACR